MQIKEINLERLTENVFEMFKEPIELYGESNNLLFLKQGKYTKVFDIKKNKYVFSSIDGIITPVVDKNNDMCFRVIKDVELYSEYGNYGMDYKIKFKNKPLCPCYFITESGKLLMNCFDHSVCRNLTYEADKYNYYKTSDFDDGQIEEVDFDNDKNFKLLYSNEDFKLHERSFWDSIINYSFSNKEFDRTFKKEETDDWEAITRFKWSLAIVYKGGKYAVINDEHKIVFDYDENIKYISILSKEYIGLRNKDGQNAIYKLGYGYIVNFTDENKFDHIHMFNNVFAFEKENKIRFMDIKGNILLDINSENIYMSKYPNKVIYKEGNNFYCYNFKTNKKQILNFCPTLKTEDNECIDADISDIIDEYKFYHINEANHEIILYKSQKYGIQLQHDEIKSNTKWFDTQKKAYLFEKQVLDAILDMSYEKEPKTNNIKRKVKAI